MKLKGRPRLTGTSSLSHGSELGLDGLHDHDGSLKVGW